MTKLWVGNKMYLVDDAVSDLVDQQTALCDKLAEALEVIESLNTLKDPAYLIEFIMSTAGQALAEYKKSLPVSDGEQKT